MKAQKYHWVAMAIFACATLLSGCTAIPNIRNTDRDVGIYTNTADKQVQDRINSKPTPDEPVVRVITNKVWVNTTASVRTTGADAPILSCNISYSPKAQPVRLAHVIARISEQCHLPVRLTADASAKLAGAYRKSESGNAATASQQQLVPPLASAPPAFGSQYQQTQTDDQYNEDRIFIDYANGPVSGLIDAATAQVGLSSRYDADKGVEVIYYLETRNFHMASITQATGVDATVQSGASAAAGTNSGSGTGSTSTGGINGTSQSQSATNVKSQTDLLHDLQSAIQSVLSAGGKVSISPAFGTVTVTDTPDAVDRAAEVVDRANDVLGRQVQLDVRTTVLNLTNSDSLGLNLNALYSAVSNKYQIQIQSTNSTAPQGASSFGGTILKGNAKWDASSAIVNALSTQGNIVSDITIPITTQNLMPTPIQQGASTGYIASSQISQTQGAGSLQALQGGDVTYGFNMFVKPYIQDDRKTVIVQFGMNLSDLKDIRHMGTATNYIEHPEQTLTNTGQTAILESGQTLLLVGYAQNQLKSNWQGNGGAKFWLLGGGATTNNERQIVVVTITPKVLR